jgi:hypothetical protein
LQDPIAESAALFASQTSRHKAISQEERRSPPDGMAERISQNSAMAPGFSGAQESILGICVCARPNLLRAYKKLQLTCRAFYTTYQLECALMVFQGLAPLEATCQRPLPGGRKNHAIFTKKSTFYRNSRAAHLH